MARCSQELEAKLRSVYEDCLSCALPLDDIRARARPIVGIVGSACLRRYLFAVTVFVVAAAVFVMTPVVPRVLIWFLRYIQLLCLSLYDWTHLFRSECLVDNPFFAGPQLIPADCQRCEVLSSVPRLSNLSSSVALSFLSLDRPFVVTDDVTSWPAASLTVSTLCDLYHEVNDLGNTAPCQFYANVKDSRPKELLKKIEDELVSNVYAHWEHCSRLAARSFRPFYHRPYFLPQSVEMAESHWMFVSHDYHGKGFKPVDVGLPVIFVAVLQGHMNVSLTPRPPCHHSCDTLFTQLQQTDMIVFTDLLWTFDYLPADVTVAIATGGFFD